MPEKVSDMMSGTLEQAQRRTVSVIIPVFNGAQYISKCIEAILDQSYRSDLYEVLVIDNNSQDNTRLLIQKHPVRLLIEDRLQCSFAARNRGIMYAQGDIIAFTDSDCVPNFDWIEKGVGFLERNRDCALVAGRIDIFFNYPNHPNIIELYEKFAAFQQKKYVERYHFGATANVFTWKSLFNEIGFFNPLCKESGDREWGQRLFLSGYQLLYADEARIAHPARSSFSQLHQKVFRVTSDIYDLNKYSFSLPDEGRGGLSPVISSTSQTFMELLSSNKLSGTGQKCKVAMMLIYVKILRTLINIYLRYGRAKAQQYK
jgi:glycosyltransferase involved in cell wall biosynthesis